MFLLRNAAALLPAAAATFALASPAALALSPWEASIAFEQVQRPLPSYIRITPPVDDRAPSLMFAPGGAALPLYLNRFGGTYVCGNDDSATNQSSVVCGGSGTGTVGGFSGSTTQWTNVLTCVQDLFSPFNVYVTDVEPLQGDYVEAVVGGTPDQAGMPNGVGGVAPFGCQLLPSAVVYAFSDVYGNDMRGVCETVAQEVAHAFGLDHEFLCSDPMTYLNGCGNKSFQDTYAQCGEFEPRECSCGGTSQNSVQSMLQILGASDGSPPPPPPNDTEVPTVSFISPAADAILDANSTITVIVNAHDDIGLPTVALEWDFTATSMYCPATVQQTGTYACAKSGDTYTWTIQVGTGGRTFRVYVRDVVGNTITSEDRTIWLSEDGGGPPTDLGPPEIFVATPFTGAVLPANEPMEVVATISDDSGVARADLVWTNGEEALFPCPSENQGVSCSIDGNTYTWRLQVGAGRRSFHVRATDLVGAVTETEERTISLEDGASIDDDDREGDDILDDATELSCGDIVELVATDADWFSINAPKGETVVVTVFGEARGNVSLVATRGITEADVIVDGHNGVEFPADGSDVKVAVLPDDANVGSYTVEVYCESAVTTIEPPKGCASSGMPASLLGLLPILGFISRRRRR